MQSQPQAEALAGRSGQREPRRAIALARLTVIAPALLLALSLTLPLLPAHAQTVTPTAFATAVTPLVPEELAPTDQLVFHGEAARVSATINETPLPLGGAFPAAEPPLLLRLRYDNPLPIEIPSVDSLGVYHYGGSEWAKVAATLTRDENGGEFAVSVSRTGDYAVAATALEIVVQPPAVTLRQGQTAQFTATVLDAEGQPVPGLTVAWQATSAAGAITAAGLFTATGAPGTYKGAVLASLGSREGYADVTIRAWTTYVPLALRGWQMQLRPNDPLFGLQWNLLRIRAPHAWATTTGGPVVVAVIDTGVDLDHPDLQANLVPGVDYVDKVPGGLPSSTPDDKNGHGTHVAGIVGAVGNNAIGVTGVAWTTRIMPLRVLDAVGNGYVSDAVLAIKWAVDHGARIINLSLGTPNTSALIPFGDAVRYAQDRNVLVVAAAGNVPPFTMGQPAYPADFAGVMGVGSTGPSDALSSFSNQGPWVDVTAPGEGVFSTFPVTSYPPAPGYQALSGTSMATPHVSGLAALLWARYPHLSAVQVAAIIRASAQDLGPAGYDPGYGWGRIDAAAALTLAESPGLLGASEEREPAADAVGSPRETTASASAEPASYRPGHLLVAVDPRMQEQGLSALPGELTALSAEDLIPGWLLVRVPEGSEAEARARLAEQPGILGVYFDAPIYAMD